MVLDAVLPTPDPPSVRKCGVRRDEIRNGTTILSNDTAAAGASAAVLVDGRQVGILPADDAASA